MKSLKELMTSLKKNKTKSEACVTQKNSNTPTLLVANINMRLMITSSMIVDRNTRIETSASLCNIDEEGQLGVPLHGILQILICIEIDIGPGGFVTVLHNNIILDLQPVA